MVENNRDFFEMDVRQMYEAVNESCPTGGEFDAAMAAFIDGGNERRGALCCMTKQSGILRIQAWGSTAREVSNHF
jgi:hypothetical protein